MYKHISEAVSEFRDYTDKRRKGEIRSLKTGWDKLDKVLLNGLDWNRILSIAGLSGCLSGDTEIKVRRGKRSGGRVYTIEELYNKFHNQWNKNIKSNIQVYKEDLDTFGYNEILDVVFSGIKPVYRVITKSGFKIVSTLEHKYLTGLGKKDESLFKELKELKIGDKIVLRKRNIKKDKSKSYRKSLTGQFRYYANARIKIVDKKYTYFECLEQRAVYDAVLNGFSDVNKFLTLCCQPNNFIFSDSSLEIHHINGDTTDNRLENLELLSKADHAKKHLNFLNNMYNANLEEIVNIEYLGEIKTYDICCKSPYNNFIANSFVVHNSGKSMMLEQLKKQLLEYNTDIEFEILSFEFEMMPQDQIARSVSGTTGLSTKDLYSQNTPVSDELFDKVVQITEKINKYPLFYIEEISTVADIVGHVMNFIKSRELVRFNKNLVVTIDHTLLTKGLKGDTEKETLDELSHAMIHLKRAIKSMGINSIIIMLAQLNRDIEKPERTMNPNLHYPTKNDIFGASSIYYCSDYVLITHMPSIALQGSSYGPPRPGFPSGLPVYTSDSSPRPMIYWHVIKERFGEKAVLSMINYFEQSQIREN